MTSRLKLMVLCLAFAAVPALARNGATQSLHFRLHAISSVCSHSCNSPPMVPGINSPASSCQP